MIKSINTNIMKLYYDILDKAGIPINIEDNFINDPLEFLKIVREHYEYTQNRPKELRFSIGTYDFDNMKNCYYERFFIEDDFEFGKNSYNIFVASDYNRENDDKNYKDQSYTLILRKYVKQTINNDTNYDDVCEFNIDINFEVKYLDVAYTDYDTYYSKKIDVDEFVEKYNEYRFPWNVDVVKGILDDNNIE